jgi:hypothetical protein
MAPPPGRARRRPAPRAAAAPLTQAAYARHRGVTRQAVSKAIRDGLISTRRDGLIDAAVADRVWRDHTTPPTPATPAKARAGKGRARQTAQERTTSRKFYEARGQREYWQAQIAELEARRRAGQVVSIERVRSAGMATARMVRDALLGIPARLRDVLAATTDPADVDRILTAELEQACQQLNRPPEGLVADGRGGR